MIENKKLYIKSTLFGMGLGGLFGALIGAATGALSASWDGIQFGAISGIIFGAWSGALTGALIVRTVGTTGGVSIGAYTGMAFGAIFGGILGFFIPDSFRADVASLNILILQVMTQGRFETAMLLSFLLSVIATIVGAWVGGRNLKAREIGRVS